MNLREKVVNTLRPGQNGRHFADDIFNCIFLNENVWIPIKISLKFVPKGPVNNIPALVQIMAWRRPGDKPLSEPMMVRLPTHTCVTRPQWVNCSDKGWLLTRNCRSIDSSDWYCGWKHVWHTRKDTILCIFKLWEYILQQLHIICKNQKDVTQLFYHCCYIMQHAQYHPRSISN